MMVYRSDGPAERGGASALHGGATYAVDMMIDAGLNSLFYARLLGDTVLVAQAEDMLRHLKRHHAPGNSAILRALG